MNSSMVKTFILVYENKTITKAAEILNQSKINVRKTIMNLEKELGVLLFERSRKGMLHTNEADELYSVAKYVQFNINELDEFYRDEIVLRIASFYISYVPKALVNVINSSVNKALKYSYLTTDADNVFWMLLKEKCDIGIFNFSREHKKEIDKICRENEIEYEILDVNEPCIIIKENHPLSSKDFVTPKDISDFKRIGSNDDCRKIIGYKQIFNRLELDSRADIILDSMINITKFLNESEYYFIGVNSPIGKGYINSLIEVPLKETNIELYVVIGYKKNIKLLPEGISFIKSIKEYYGKGVENEN